MNSEKLRQPRGLRNKNPLNIVKNPNISWQGDIKPSTDKNFAQFETLAYGCRAALKLLRTYYEKHHCRTISSIIRRWAPETENNVQAYIRNVSRMTGIEPTTLRPPMKEETKIVWCDLVLAMTTVECGLDAKTREELSHCIEDAWHLIKR